VALSAVTVADGEVFEPIRIPSSIFRGWMSSRSLSWSSLSSLLAYNKRRGWAMALLRVTHWGS
jgi:hypothetical protein